MSAKTCNACRRRAVERQEAAMRRKRAMVVSLVGAALLVLLTGLWSAGVTGDAKLAAGGVGLSLCVLWFANETEAS